jgi:hypothetical protein
LFVFVNGSGVPNTYNWLFKTIFRPFDIHWFLIMFSNFSKYRRDSWMTDRLRKIGSVSKSCFGVYNGVFSCHL